jgi:hypothetical protein
MLSYQNAKEEEVDREMHRSLLAALECRSDRCAVMNAERGTSQGGMGTSTRGDRAVVG